MNKVSLIGRPTADPDVRYSNDKNGNQMCVARYTLAVDRKGKDAGADFISCVAFGKNGEFAEKYVKKGNKYGVSGRIQTGSYTNKEGKKVYTTDVVVEEHDFCDSKKDDNTQPAPQESTEGGFISVPEGIENDLPFK